MRLRHRRPPVTAADVLRAEARYPHVEVSLWINSEFEFAAKTAIPGFLSLTENVLHVPDVDGVCLPVPGERTAGGDSLVGE